MKQRGIFIRRYAWGKAIFHYVKTLLKYIKRKCVYKVNVKTNLQHKIITAKEIHFNHCQSTLLRGHGDTLKNLKPSISWKKQ